MRKGLDCEYDKRNISVVIFDTDVTLHIISDYIQTTVPELANSG